MLAREACRFQEPDFFQLARNTLSADRSHVFWNLIWSMKQHSSVEVWIKRETLNPSWELCLGGGNLNRWIIMKDLDQVSVMVNSEACFRFSLLCFYHIFILLLELTKLKKKSFLVFSCFIMLVNLSFWIACIVP